MAIVRIQMCAFYYLGSLYLCYKVVIMSYGIAKTLIEEILKIQVESGDIILFMV